VYQRATLKAMETSSKIASCWALGGRAWRNGGLHKLVQAHAHKSTTPRLNTKHMRMSYELNQSWVMCSPHCSEDLHTGLDPMRSQKALISEVFQCVH